MTFLRSFGTNTTWYLHSWTVCAELSFTCLLLSCDDHRNSGLIVGKELFFFKYYSIAFSILPGVAGGLAWELFTILAEIRIHFRITGSSLTILPSRNRMILLL